MEFRKLLTKAQHGDMDAKDEIIKRYYPLIVKESKSVYLKGHSFEDIVQIGVVNLLNAIEKFDITKSTNSFSSYALWSVRNGFRYLCRQEIRYNDEYSLNSINADGIEFADTLVSDLNLEASVLRNLEIERVRDALKTLDLEEQELIYYLYFSGNGTNLSKYAKEYIKDYYYCICLKRRAFKKLKDCFKY